MMTKTEIFTYFNAAALSFAMICGIHGERLLEERSEQPEQPAETRTLQIDNETLNKALANLTRPVVPPPSTLAGRFEGAASDETPVVSCYDSSYDIPDTLVFYVCENRDDSKAQLTAEMN